MPRSLLSHSYEKNATSNRIVQCRGVDPPLPWPAILTRETERLCKREQFSEWEFRKISAPIPRI